MAFSATMAALEGFRLTRRQPAAVASWAVLMLVFNLAIITTLIGIAGPALTEMTVARGNPSGDPERMLSLMGQMVVAYMVVIPMSLIVVAVATTAVYRAMKSEKGDRAGFLRLGVAELRQILVSLVVGVIGFVGLFVLTLLISLVIGFFAALLGAGGGGAANAAGFVVMILLVYLMIIIGWLAFYVKFSFAGPMTFADNRIRIFASWKATSGRFWSLFGCYLFAGVLGVIVILIGIVIALAVAVAFGASISEVMQPDMSSIAAYYTPGVAAYTVVTSIFSALFYTIILSPAASAYQQIYGRAEDISGTFS